MSELVTIGNVTTSVITYKGRRVCATEQLAKFYNTEEARIRQNHARNAGRFEEGKHFIKVVGAELKNLQVSLSDLQISTKARHLILWTERGAARHAKMLETDQAWDVYEQMEDSYFAGEGGQRHAAVGEGLSTTMDRLPLYHFAIDTGIKHHVPFSKAYSLMNLFAGCRTFKDMSKEQIPELLDFCDRFAIGQDTRNDWQRITDNQVKLYGEPAQLDMVQKLLLL